MMKKLLTSCLLLAAFVLPTKAVDAGTDMTSYIQNAGFEGGSTSISGDMNCPNNWKFTYTTAGWSGSWVGTNGNKTVAEGVNYFNTWADQVTSYDINQGINTLPGGIYTLTALMRVTSNAGEVTNQHIYAKTGNKIVCDTMVNTNIGDNLENWQKLTVEFTVAADNDSVYVGAASTGSGSSPAGWFQLDDFQLVYKMGLSEQAALEAMQTNYNNKLKEMSSLEASADVVDRSAFVTEIEDYVGGLNVDMNDMDAMKAAIVGMDSIIADVNTGITNAKALEALITSSSKEAQETNYPGFDTFQAAVEAAQAVSSNDESKTADYTNALAALTSAFRTYRMSQEASAEKPANYTFLISYPRFSSAASKAEETTKTVMSTGWVKGSTYTGGDQNASYCQCRNCWNSWWSVSTADAGTKNMDVHQVLSDLPTGYYGISCLAITQEGCLTDQHAYVTSTAGTAVSPNLATTGWVGDDATGAGTWDSLTTEKILVTDGHLTIGFTSTKTNGNDSNYSGDDREGWWCVTQFQLNFYGKADDEALAIAYNTKLAVATAMADTMHFSADKKALNDSITLATGATGTEAINKAMATLSNALVNAAKSESYYTEIMTKGKTYPTLRDSLANSTTAYGAANAIVKYAYDKLDNYIKASTTTYSTVDAFLTKAKKYVSDYASAFNAASDSSKTLKSATALKELNATLTSQSGILTSSDTLYRAVVIDTLIARLKVATSICLAQDKYENGATDYTFMIQNPNAGGATANSTGWVINKGTGNTTISSGGQHYNGTGLCYFDSWNGTTGKLNYYAYQNVNNIPNGTYTMKVACRTSANKGAFVFASNGGAAKSDTIWKRIELQKYYDATNDTTIIADDERGSIWQVADDAVNAGTATDIQQIQASTNNNTGRGWEWVTIEGITITNHKMVIGMCTDSLRTGEGFTGTWFSAVDFSIVKTADGDNTGWGGPITNVNAASISEKNATVNGIFSISGVKMNSRTNLPKGIYIMKEGNTTKKVMIR